MAIRFLPRFGFLLVICLALCAGTMASAFVPGIQEQVVPDSDGNEFLNGGREDDRQVLPDFDEEEELFGRDGTNEQIIPDSDEDEEILSDLRLSWFTNILRDLAMRGQ